MDITRKLTKFRIELGMNSKEFAEFIGLPPTTYSNYENKNRTPTLDNLVVICKALNLSLDELVFNNIEDMITPTVDELLEAKLVQYFRVLNEKGKIKILEDAKILNQIQEYTNKPQM